MPDTFSYIPDAKYFSVDTPYFERHTDWSDITKEQEVITHQAAASHQLEIPTEW